MEERQARHTASSDPSKPKSPSSRNKSKQEREQEREEEWREARDRAAALQTIELAIAATINGSSVSRARCNDLLAQLVTLHDAGRVAKAFREIDKSKTDEVGTVGKPEFRAMLQALGLKAKPEECDAVFGMLVYQYDDDGNGRFDFKELSRALRLAKQTAARKEQEARESKEKVAAARAGGEGKKAAAAGAAAKSAKPVRPFSAPSVGMSRPKAAVGKPARR